MRRRATLALVVLSVLSYPAAADDAASVTLPLKLPPAVEVTEPVPAPQDVLAAPAAAEPAPQSPNGAPPPVPQPKPSPPAKVVEMNPVDDMPGGKPIPTPPGGAPSVRCFVRDVMAFYDRTHVRCYNKVRGKIVFFAVDTSQPVTATVLEKALKGMQTGKPVTITYAPGTDLNPSNCDRKNCRRLLDIQF